MGHYSSFILRLWVEPDLGMRWGMIEHVATRERLRFSSHAEMIEFIQSHSDVNELSLPFALETEDLTSATSDGNHNLTGNAAQPPVVTPETHSSSRKKQPRVPGP